MPSLSPLVLRGSIVTLEPLTRGHADGLVDAVRDGQLWNLWYTSVPTPEGMTAEIDRRLALQEAGSMLPFATRRTSNGLLLGMTTYMNIDVSVPRVEIGSTWNRASARGSGSNAESKLLLLGHAFDTLGCPVVEFRTHWMNHRSRTAIEYLGARLDGVLRAHQRSSDGALRDTCVYSITATEWPQVRSGLLFRLARSTRAEGPGREDQ